MPRFSSRALQGASHCLCWLAFFPQCNLVLPVHQLSFLWPLLLDECCSHMLQSKFGSCSSTVCSCQNVGTTMTPKISSFAFQHSTQQHIDSCLLYSDMRRQLRNASCCFNFRGEFSRSEKVFLIIPTTHYRTLSSAIQKKRPAKKDLWYWNCSESSSHHNPVSQIVMIAHFFSFHYINFNIWLFICCLYIQPLDWHHWNKIIKVIHFACQWL